MTKFLPAQFLFEKSIFVCVVFASLNFESLSAAELTEVPTDDEIVVVAMRSPTPLSEIGSSVTIITAEEIKARQYSFVADALRDAPGVSIARNGGAGGTTAARIRGASSGQTLVLIDGVVMNDASAPQGGFNFANVDVADIERIEILRGPQSLLYGADAIGGVISITTKKHAAGSGAYAEGGSRASFRGGASATLGDAAAYGRFTLSGMRTDGISRAASGTEKDGYRTIAGSFSGGAQLNEQWSVALTGRYADSHTEIDGFPPPAYTFADTAETEDTSEYAVAGKLMHDTANLDGALTISYNSVDRKNLDGSFTTFSATGNRLSADYIVAADLSSALSIIGGGKVERTAVDVSGVDETAKAGALFAMIEVKPLRDITLSVGARRDEFSNFDGATTARVAAAWAGPDDLVLRGSWGQGFRAPSLFELNFDQFGTIPNPNLKPEHASGFDLGAEKRFGPAGEHSIAVIFFQTRVKDQIDYDLAGSGYFNIDETRSRGVEFTTDLQLNDLVATQFSYSYVDAIDLATGQQLARQPKHKGVASFVFTPIDRVRLSSSVIFNGRENDSPTMNDRFIRIDLRAEYAFSNHLELYGRIENAADSTYQDVSGYSEPGISVFGGVRVRL